MGASDVHAILWEGYMDMCACVWGISPSPANKKWRDVILCKSHINTTQAYCLGSGFLSLHSTYLYMYVYIFTGHSQQSLLLTSHHIPSSVPPITLSFRVKKRQVRDAFGWPLNAWEGKGENESYPQTQSSLFMALRFFFSDGSLVYFKPKVLSSKMT